MSDFNTPQQLSSGKWIYQGTEYSKNPLAKKATTKPKEKTKKRKEIDLDAAYKNAKSNQKVGQNLLGSAASGLAKSLLDD